MTAPRHVDVGAFLLGILDESDGPAYERHFEQCEQCRREFIELADLPAFLDILKPAKQDHVREPAPTLPPLDALIDFKQLSPPPAPPAAAPIPPQQRPAGATQPAMLPDPAPPNGPGRRTNGTATPAPKAGTPVPPHRKATGGPVRAKGPAGPAAPAPRAENTGRHAPARPGQAESSGHHTPVGPRPANPATRSRAESTGRSAPVAPRGESATRSSPALPPAAKTPAKPPVKPPSKPRAAGPAGRAGGRRDRKPVWLAAAALAVVALGLGVVISLGGSGDAGTPSAERNPATTTPPNAVAGAHVVTGTDPESGVTAIITIEPVADGTEIDMALYEIDGPQEGTLIAVTRFGDRPEVAEWTVPAGGATHGKAVRTSGVVDFGQQDIIRFELHGKGIEPLLVVPT